jgi:SHS2 domain-containing protein
MKFNIPVTDDNMYFRYLSAINGMLNLSNKETLVLSEFLKYHMEYKDAEVAITPVTRKRVQEKFDMSPYNVNNVVKNLTKKKALIKSDKSLVINPNVIPKTFDGQIFVTFNFVNIK